MPRSLIKFWIASLVLTLAWPALAEGPRVQVLPAADSVAALHALVEAELNAAGLQVVTDDPVDAVVRLSDAPRTVTLWTAHDMRLRTYAADPRAAERSDDALARQVAEVLRAELVLRPRHPSPTTSDTGEASQPKAVPSAPLESAPVPEVVYVELTPPEAPPRRLPRPWGGLTVAPTVALSPGPLPPIGLLTLSPRAEPWRGFEVAPFAALPLNSVVASEAQGDLVATTGHLGVRIGYDLLASTPWALVPELGASWQWMHITGRANPPFVSTRARTHFGWLFAGATLRCHVMPSLALIAGGRVGFAMPRLRLTIADEGIGGYGRPAAHLFGGIDIPWGATW